MFSNEKGGRCGLYITVTGPDGAGKDSALNLVFPTLENYTVFREPGGTKEAELIRTILLTTNEKIRNSTFHDVLQADISIRTKSLVKKAKDFYKLGRMDLTEVYLYAASRSETNEKVVKRFLQDGKLVIGSRSVSCSMAYQGGARGIDTQRIWDINMGAIDHLPDLEIFIDIPTDIAMERLAKREGKQDRLDLESFDFHQKSRQGYFDFFEQKKYPVQIVDGTKSVDNVAADILNLIKGKVNEKKCVSSRKNS